MKVYCYYDFPEYSDYPMLVMDRWSASWRANGFFPQILSELTAWQHPDFGMTCKIVEALPTVNQRRFERACFLRWLAYDLVAPALFTDFDVINFNLKPNKVPPSRWLSLESPPSPGLIHATKEGTSAFLADFGNAMDHVIDWKGQPTVSDLYIFDGTYRGRKYDYSVLYGDDRMLTSHCVHFANGRCPEGWKFANRYLAIDDLYQKRKLERPTL